MDIKRERERKGEGDIYIEGSARLGEGDTYIEGSARLGEGGGVGGGVLYI